MLTVEADYDFPFMDDKWAKKNVILFYLIKVTATIVMNKVIYINK